MRCHGVASRTGIAAGGGSRTLHLTLMEQLYDSDLRKQYAQVRCPTQPETGFSIGDKRWDVLSAHQSA